MLLCSRITGTRTEPLDWEKRPTHASLKTQVRVPHCFRLLSKLSNREWRCPMATANPTQGLSGVGKIVKKASGWFIAMAVVFIVLGIFAIVEPGVAGLAATILVGWLLIFGGGAHLVAAFSGGGAGRVIWQVLIGIVYIVGGFYFLAHPLLGLGTLTLLLGVIILVAAVCEAIAYFRSRGRRRLGLAPIECAYHSAARWADLVPLAVEFGVGDRNTGGREPADDRNFETDVRPGSAETSEPRGGLADAS
jgi:uncharacterized membrane protein HdeD (DUF308 family)